MLSGKHNAPNRPQRPNHQRRGKRSPLTHFLCLPLVNETSLPQLEASFAAFTSTHPPIPVAELSNGQHQRAETTVSQAAIPQGAVRPLGTIHLTIGVMSLPTQERLDEALAFFQTLDLAGLLWESERVASELRQKRALKSRSFSSRPVTPEDQSPSSYSALDLAQMPRPLSISLESLHALPRAKAATVLHASPVDPTGRLYPFCFMLRDKFLEAGFMLSEAKNGLPAEKTDTKATTEEVQSSKCKDLNGDDNPSLEELSRMPSPPSDGSVRQPKTLDPYAAALARKPKPRPLLLHATLVNTIYVRGRRQFQPGRNGKNGSGHLEFDAREILDRYRNYYVDETRSIARADFAARSEFPGGKLSLSDSRVEENSKAESNADTASAASRTQYPFIWARDIPINAVCICEMGAKRLEVGGPGDHGLNARLGEEYTIIAKRSLVSRPRPPSSSRTDVAMKA